MSPKRFSYAFGAAAVLSTAITADAAYTQLATLSEIVGTSGASQFNSFAIQGDDLYATVTNGAFAITKVSDLSGTKTSSVLTPQSSISAVNGGATFLSGSTGFGFRAPDSIQFADSGSAGIYRVDASTGAISSYVSSGDINTALGITNTQILGVHGNISTGEYAFYQARNGSRALMATTGPGSVSTLLDSTALTALNGSDQLAGGIASIGNSVFFSTGSSGTRNLYAYSLSMNTAALVFTETQIAALNSNGTAFSLSEIFAAPDGLVYLRNAQSRDIFSFDPDDAAASLKLVISRDELETGPANTANVTHLDWYDGNLAFAVTSTAGGAEAGVFAIPEPSVLILSTLIVPGFLLRRRR